MKKRTLVFIALLILFFWSVLIEPRWVAVRELEARFLGEKKLGLKIIITSDWHLTQRPLWRVMTKNRATKIIEDINSEKPDVILIAGDLIAEENQTPELGNSIEDDISITLSKLKAKFGVYAVLGNHDNWYDHQKMKLALQERGINVLENDVRQIPNTRLWLAGIGDESTNHARTQSTLNALPKNVPSLALMHDPGSFRFAPKTNAIFIAGHTHGGQIFLPWLGAPIVPYAAPRAWAYGWVNHHGNRMYVTSGLGVSILPIRFNMRPEWVIMEI